MGDMGDYYRDLRDARRAAGLPARRGHKTPAVAVKLTKEWKRLGFEVRTEWHWQARVGGTLVDYWPSKSKWQIDGAVKVGPTNELRAIVAKLGERP